MIDDETRKWMIETYYDGGVSSFQIVELGHKQPGIKAFLDFSEKYEGVPFRAISSFGGIEFAFDYESHFAKIDVTGLDLATCMDGHTDAIRLVCRKILASMDSAKQLKESGEVHLASRGLVINPTAVKAFILAVLDARERYQQTEIIPELYYLLSQVLLPGEPDVEKIRQSKDIKMWASLLAWAYHSKHGSYPSYRKLSQLFGVAPSTISRLFKGQEDFEKCATRISASHEDASKHPALRDIYPRL